MGRARCQALSDKHYGRREIIALPKKAKLTQGQLAKRAGIRVETISRLESGKHIPSVRTMEKIEAAIRGMAGS